MIKEPIPLMEAEWHIMLKRMAAKAAVPICEDRPVKTCSARAAAKKHQKNNFSVTNSPCHSSKSIGGRLWRAPSSE